MPSLRQPQGRIVPGPSRRHSSAGDTQPCSPACSVLKPPRSDLAGSKVGSSVHVAVRQLAQLSSRSRPEWDQEQLCQPKNKPCDMPGKTVSPTVFCMSWEMSQHHATQHGWCGPNCRTPNFNLFSITTLPSTTSQGTMTQGTTTTRLRGG